jgi:hypothetical protein
MTAAATHDGTQVELVHLSIALPQARELTAVLPWVLQALQDRPGLTAKQRRRRQMTHAALGDLLAQLGEGLQTHPPADARKNGL